MAIALFVLASVSILIVSGLVAEIATQAPRKGAGEPTRMRIRLVAAITSSSHQCCPKQAVGAYADSLAPLTECFTYVFEGIR